MLFFSLGLSPSIILNSRLCFHPVGSGFIKSFRVVPYLSRMMQKECTFLLQASLDNLYIRIKSVLFVCCPFWSLELRAYALLCEIAWINQDNNVKICS